MRVRNGLLFLGVSMLAVACATTPAAPPSVNVTGSWAGTWSYENPSVGAGDVRGTFQQDQDKVTGSFQVTGPVVNRSANITGTVAGNEIRLSLPSTGTLTVSGEQITGTINGLNVARVTLKKQ